MWLRLIALGHKAPAWIEEGCVEYRKRLPREWQFEERLLKAEKRTDKHISPSHILVTKSKEADRIEEAWKDSTVRITLDERGKLLTSRELAAYLKDYQAQSDKVAYVIGGTDGLDQRILSQSHLSISLSRFTLPHDMARVILMEQLYRASTLLSGHPYHRD